MTTSRQYIQAVSGSEYERSIACPLCARRMEKSASTGIRHCYNEDCQNSVRKKEHESSRLANKPTIQPAKMPHIRLTIKGAKRGFLECQ